MAWWPGAEMVTYKKPHVSPHHRRVSSNSDLRFFPLASEQLGPDGAASPGGGPNHSHTNRNHGTANRNRINATLRRTRTAQCQLWSTMELITKRLLARYSRKIYASRESYVSFLTRRRYPGENCVDLPTPRQIASK